MAQHHGERFGRRGWSCHTLAWIAAVDDRITPDTGHGEDVGGFIGFAVVIPFLAVGVLLGIGGGIGALALSTGCARALPAVGIALAVPGLGFGTAPIRI